MFRLVMACGFLGCFCCAFGQVGSLDPAQRAVSAAKLYESFFDQVALWPTVPSSSPLIVNGQPSNLKQPTIAEATGLTGTESESLKTIAVECNARLRQFDLASRSAIFDARVSRIAEGNSDTDESAAVKQLNDLADKHRQLALGCIERLRSTLGDPRFRTLDSWVQERRQGQSFFLLGVSVVKQ
jgi:hypothetical protein